MHHQSRAPLVLVHLSCITCTHAPISCTSTLVHPTRALISCTTNLVHPTRASLVLVHPSRAPLLWCTHLVHHPYSCTNLVHHSYSCTTPTRVPRRTLVHHFIISCTAVLHSYHSRAPLSCNSRAPFTSFLNCRGTSHCLAVETSTRVPSCTTPQSRAPLRNLVHLLCTAVLHSYHSRALLSCTPHKLPQLSWHFPLPGRQIPHSRSFLNSRAPLKCS